MNKSRMLAAAFLCSLLFACADNKNTELKRDITHAGDVAPGAPGRASTWAYSAKTGIGTSYEAYVDGQHSSEANTGAVSKLWFSVAEGVLTETMYGMIHEAQLKDMQLVVVGDDFVDVENTATNSEIDYLYKDAQGRPLSLAYKIVNTDKQGLYSIEKHIFTDPERDVLWHRVIFKPKQAGLRLFVYANPHIGNTGEGDRARVVSEKNTQSLYASQGEQVMGLYAGAALANASVGFVGVSDLLSDLADNKLDWQYTSSSEQSGNVALAAELISNDDFSSPIDILLSFAGSEQQAKYAAEQSRQRGYEKVLAAYNGIGDSVGWQDYLVSLDSLDTLAAESLDGGALLYASALVLKAQEDKTHSGALIASLSNPWGDKVSAAQSSTGYKAVWPRDFYQCAMAFLALGDSDTAKVAFSYLKKIQVGEQMPENKGQGGWFLQKTHVDGTIEWVAVQLDQTAMPLMLAWKLWQLEVLSEQELAYWYEQMLKPAADFLVTGGKVNIDWNHYDLRPPYTQQERWEEQKGYSPSTIAATIAGLVAAADIAQAQGDLAAHKRWLQAADNYEASLEQLTFTTSGHFREQGGNGRYYLRINASSDPNDNGPLEDRNGRGVIYEKNILDGGFLELVRYGVRAPDNSYVLDSLPELDNQQLEHKYRVKYLFEHEGKELPGWRRYGEDGYGEDTTQGMAYSEGGKHRPSQRGRVWPFFSGERGHYELAAAGENADITELRNTYVAAMEFFANEGLMLPEQVWDGVGSSGKRQFNKGQGTNSATPLAWTHAEYVKLLRSLHDVKVWDHYSIVADRYQK
ncbi:glucan 1,4-alpha-glucosidase [Agaribacterium haliotis]|uniref:glucan 1,4-alpha-glucosidase n=1 Tax=Agaribacterium haliotis TaxID=2013869 RepID=UPI000BB5461C|nr:glucan 1,4-alpha-glucosidase [Agaribacterium haliotis]